MDNTDKKEMDAIPVFEDESPLPEEYDKNAKQTLEFTQVDSDAIYEWVFVLKHGLTDEILLEYDRLQEVIITEDGEDKVLGVNSIPASSWFFDNHLDLVGGFEGSLPDRWQKEFDSDFKERVVGSILYADVVSSDAPKEKKKFVFGKASSNSRDIKITTRFNGEDVELTFKFTGRKDPKLIHEYREITGAAKFKKGREGTFLPSNWTQLLALYRKVGFEVSGGNPAVHLKVMAVRELFDTTVRLDQKKQKS